MSRGSRNKGIDSPSGGHLILTKRLTSPRSRSLLFVLKHNSGAFGSAFARRAERGDERRGERGEEGNESWDDEGESGGPGRVKHT